MTTASDSPRPTAAELEILRILWDLGPATVRQVHEVLGRTRRIGYTGVLKFLQIMTAKKLVKRTAESRAHLYQAAQPAKDVQCQVAQELLERAFHGSLSELIDCLADESLSAEEVTRARRILDERAGK